MKNLHYILIILLLTNCSQTVKKETISKNAIDITSSGSDTLQRISIWPKEVLDSCHQNYKNYKLSGIKIYNINNFTSDSIDLVKIDSVTLRKIHDYKGYGIGFTWGFNADLEINYFYSIDSCINGLYPITILELEKFSTFALYMYLFDKSGIIVSSDKLAWKGEVFRRRLNNEVEPDLVTFKNMSDPQFCYLSSQRYNDSIFFNTRVCPDSLIDKSTWISAYNQTKTKVTSDGEFTKLDTRVWRK
jgi:hypothetical protein